MVYLVALHEIICHSWVTANVIEADDVNTPFMKLYVILKNLSLFFYLLKEEHGALFDLDRKLQS